MCNVDARELLHHHFNGSDGFVGKLGQANQFRRMAERFADRFRWPKNP